nr:glycoside hydrolase family 27 protein [uncultured Draconibacterium sp.]
MKYLLLIFILLFSITGFAQKSENLAPAPPMGWNSWNWFGKKNINEQVIKECMDAMVAEGLLDAGYEYFVIDGGWRDTKLGPNGELLAHPVKFPNSIKPLADYAHSLGLKFGLHTVPGTHDCAGDQVGGFGNEEIQIQQFIDWGLDFIKLDKCIYKPEWDEKLLKETYEKWRNILDKSERDVVLNISAYKYRDWYPEVCQMARTTFDIGAQANYGAHFDYTEKEKNFLSVMEVAEVNNSVAHYAGGGYWNDPDMMVIGNPGLSLEEQKSHFALWCIMSSPLFLGNDPRNMTPEEKEIITNELAIAINQDPTEQGKRIKVNGKTEVWAKKLGEGNVAVLFLNRDAKKTEKVEISLTDLGLSGKFRLTDVYTSEDLGKVLNGVSYEVGAHSGKFLLIESEI